MTPIQVNKSCDELYMGGKYNYSTSLHCKDPEINWKSLDEIALGQERFLIRDYCESGIQCTVTCTNPVNEMEYIFNVFNSSTPTTEAANVYGTQINTIISIVISIIVVAILIVGLIVGMCYRKRRVIVGLGEKLIRGCCQRADENNRSDIPLEDITERNTEGEAQVNTSNNESVDPGNASANGFMNGDVRTEEARPLRLHPYS